MEDVKQGDQPTQTDTPVADPSAVPAAPKPPQTTKRNQTPPPAAARSPSAPVEPVKLNIRNRHDISFRHDCFRSDDKQCLRNVSYKEKQPELIKVMHAHVYHSHSNNGKKLTKTGAALGHWHDVSHYVDPATGQPAAKCGPAMHEVTFMTSSGRVVSRVEPVSFEQEITSGEDDGKVKRIMDDHTHELIYLGSEELSPSGIANDLKSQQAQAAAMGITLGGVKDNTPPPMTPADGATIT